MKLSLTSLEKALKSLADALALYDKHRDDEGLRLALRDSVIQRFEYSFELAWKHLKRYLELEGESELDAFTRRKLFRLAWEKGLLSGSEEWFDYLKMRNLSSHTYNEETAQEVFTAAGKFLVSAKELYARLLERLND